MHSSWAIIKNQLSDHFDSITGLSHLKKNIPTFDAIPYSLELLFQDTRDNEKGRKLGTLPKDL